MVKGERVAAVRIFTISVTLGRASAACRRRSRSPTAPDGPLAPDDQQRTTVGFFVFTPASVHGLRSALPICMRLIPEPATWSVS